MATLPADFIPSVFRRDADLLRSSLQRRTADGMSITVHAQPTSYDAVPYPSYTHPQTHPDRLSVIGRLFGLEPAPVTRCRVLELGCGNGSNLVPMAWALPESQFVGIDLAARPIAGGQQMVRDLGLENIKLIQGNIAEVNDGFGTFDYIIAHGLFSWVPPETQERLLTICSTRLAAHGVAFVSYNTFPGCHLRNMSREMMLFHTRGFASAEERVKQAFALVKFIAEAQDTQDEYRLWLKGELERIKEHEPGHLFHDELADVSEACYFTQFMDRATRHGLQYLGEADCFEMSDHIFKDSVRQTLNELGSNRILREQYLDFLKCRRFRQTLLCRCDASLQAEPDANTVADFLISSAAECTSEVADVRPGIKCAFETPKGARIETDLPLGKAALTVAQAIWPSPLPFDELLRQAGRKMGQDPTPDLNGNHSRDGLCRFLLQLYSAGIVEFRSCMPPMAKGVSKLPVASPVARWQVQQGHIVTSLFHIAVKVEDEIGRCLLSALDGTRDRGALLEKLWLLLQSRNALVVPDGGEAVARHNIELELEKNLEKLARLGLLVE